VKRKRRNEEEEEQTRGRLNNVLRTRGRLAGKKREVNVSHDEQEAPPEDFSYLL
jgi:hypothetical protein